MVCSWDSACTPSKAVCRASRYACYAAPAVCAAPRPAPTEDPWAALTQSTHIPRCMHATSHAWAVPGPHLLLAALVLSHYVIDVGQHQGVKLIVLLRRHAMARGAGPQLLQAPVVQGPKLDLNYSRGIVCRRHIARHCTHSRWQLGGKRRCCKRLQKIFIPDSVGRKVSIGCACLHPKWFCTPKGSVRICAPAACSQATCRDRIARHIARSPSPAQALCGPRAVCVWASGASLAFIARRWVTRGLLQRCQAQILVSPLHLPFAQPNNERIAPCRLHRAPGPIGPAPALLGTRCSMLLSTGPRHELPADAVPQGSTDVFTSRLCDRVDALAVVLGQQAEVRAGRRGLKRHSILPQALGCSDWRSPFCLRVHAA